MDYSKIAELAQQCEVKQRLQSEHYRMIGANPQFSDETRATIYSTIRDIQSELDKLESKLRKMVGA